MFKLHPSPDPHPSRTVVGAVWALAAGLLLAGCASQPTAPPPPASTGAAGGTLAVGADASLQTCSEPVGTVRLQDGNAPANTARANEPAQNATIQSMRLFLQDLKDFNPKGGGQASQGFSIESLRLLIQQSNCLVIVDRGVAEGATHDEKSRTRNSAEVRDGANMGRGQEVAADFVLRSMVLSLGEEKSSGFNVAGLIPFAAAAGVRSGTTTKAASVQLVLSDVRANLQLAAAQGAGSGSNTGLAVGVLGRLPGGVGGGGMNSGTKTQDSTILLQAFADAYNKLVPALRNYKEQSVRGGLGAGGTLRVQGNKPDASAVAAKP